eukprot:5197756-Pleurochrysis_carterae.AAC.1
MHASPPRRVHLLRADFARRQLPHRHAAHGVARLLHLHRADQVVPFRAHRRLWRRALLHAAAQRLGAAHDVPRALRALRALALLRRRRRRLHALHRTRL